MLRFLPINSRNVLMKNSRNKDGNLNKLKPGTYSYNQVRIGVSAPNEMSKKSMDEAISTTSTFVNFLNKPRNKIGIEKIPMQAFDIDKSVWKKSGFLKVLNGNTNEIKLLKLNGCCKDFSILIPAPLLKQSALLTTE